MYTADRALLTIYHHSDCVTDNLPSDSLLDTKSCINSTVLNPILISFDDVSAVFEL